MSRAQTVHVTMPDAPQLILLRHAKSDWSSGARNDFDRPLNARGRADAPRMGAWLAANGYAPEAVIASPAARAKETAELVCAALDFTVTDIVFERELYGAPADVIRAVAAEYLQRHCRVMVVCHNPGIEYALLDYCPDAPAFDDGKWIPTCAAAVIEIAGGGDGGDGGGGDGDVGDGDVGDGGDGGDGDGDSNSNTVTARLLAHIRPAQL